MNKIGYMTISVYLSGTGFDPIKMIGKYNYACNVKQKIGEKIKRGRDKGSISDYGTCTFEFDESIPYSKRITESVDLLLKIRKDNSIENLNIEYSRYDIYFTGCQGNMEFNNAELNKLSELGESIAITYISADEIDYRKQKRLNRLILKKDKEIRRTNASSG